MQNEKTTSLEKAILHAIVSNDYGIHNGWYPKNDEEEKENNVVPSDYDVWNDCLDCYQEEVPGHPFPKKLASLGGIVSSLSKKRLVYTGEESTCLSPEGWEVWKAEVRPLVLK